MPNEKHLECCLIKLLPWILFEKFIYILALEMASSGNQHCANCIGTLSFLRQLAIRPVSRWYDLTKTRSCHLSHSLHCWRPDWNNIGYNMIYSFCRKSTSLRSLVTAKRRSEVEIPTSSRMREEKWSETGKVCVYMGSQRRNFFPWLCQLIFAAIC